MKRLVIDIFDEEDGKLVGMIDMDSKELCLNYANTPTFHGLQCNFDGDTEEYNKVLENVEKISDLVRQLDKIYK